MLARVGHTCEQSLGKSTSKFRAWDAHELKWITRYVAVRTSGVLGSCFEVHIGDVETHGNGLGILDEIFVHCALVHKAHNLVGQDGNGAGRRAIQLRGWEGSGQVQMWQSSWQELSNVLIHIAQST